MIFKSILNKKNFLNESIKNKTIKWSNKIKNKRFRKILSNKFKFK